MNKKKTILIGSIIITIILFIDQLTKFMLFDKNIIISEFLEFTFTKNTDPSFGIGSNNIIMTIMVNVVILGLIIKFIKENELEISLLIPLFMVFAGGISNLADRLIRGYVVEFIKINFFDFPVFNFADICIAIGVILIGYKIIKSIIFER